MPFPFGGLLGVGGALPKLVSVSQDAGKLAGGTSLALIGTGFVTPMTSTLGSVVVNSPTSATLTTSAALISGTVAWTVTTGGATISTLVGGAGLQYTYLDPPVLISITPAHGPATLTNFTRTFICNNLPPAGSNCPVVFTVGVGTSSNYVSVSAGIATADFSAPGLGVLSATATVDGVTSASVAAVYTGDSPPIVTSMGQSGTAGGIVNASGSAFASGITGTATPVGGGITTPFTSISFTNSTLIKVTVPALAAGFYDVTVTNTGTDGQSSTTASVMQVTTVTTLATTFGADDVGDWDFRAAANSSGIVTSVPDGSGASHALSPVGSPAFNAIDPNGNYKGQASCTSNGSTSAFVSGSIPISGPDFTLIWAGMVFGDPGSAQAMIAAQAPNSTSGRIYYTTGGTGPRAQLSGNPEAGPWVSNQYGIPYIAIAQFDNTGGTNNTVSLSLNNLAAISVSRTQIAINGSVVVRIGNDSTPNWCHATHERGAIIQRTITGAEALTAVTYINVTHNILSDPTLTSVMPMKAGKVSASSRAVGTNYLGAGMIVSVIVPGTGAVACTVTAQDFVSIDYTLPGSLGSGLSAGTYDLSIDNGIGNAVVFANALTVTASDTVQTIFGSSLVFGGDPNGVTQSGGSVSIVGDNWSLLKQNMTVFGTVAPGWNAGTLSRTYNGTSQSIGKSIMDMRSTSPGCSIIAILKPTNNTGTTVVGGYKDTALMELASGKPRPNAGTAWGSTIGAAEHRVYVSIASGASPAQSVNVDESVSPIASTSGATALLNSQWLHEGAGWPNNAGTTPNSFYNGQCQAFFIINRPITVAEETAFATWYAAQGFPAM